MLGGAVAGGAPHRYHHRVSVPNPLAHDAALAGVRVLDFSRVLAGPFCTMLLGDLGADVVKIERPGSGDDTRAWGPPFVAGESAYFLCVNRNKRSLTLDLKHPRGREIARQLAAVADVLVENFATGWMEAAGLGYGALRLLNPRLIYVSITGYGHTGPDAALPGYDFLIQARGGLMSITGEPDGPPMKVGVAVADIAAGLFAAVGVLAALQARSRTGVGQHLDLALLDTQVAWLANVASAYLLSGEIPLRYGNAHPHIVPYELFPTAAGEIVLAVGNDAQFQRCCAVLGQPEWADDPRFRTNPDRVRHRQELIPLLRERLLTRPADDWIRAFRAAGVPAGPVQDLAAVFADPQVQARGMVERVAHPAIGELPLVANPLRLSGTPVATRRPPPRLGEHRAEVLGEWLGLDADSVAALAQSGAI